MPEELILDSFSPADAEAMCEVDHDPEHRRRFDFPAGFVPSVEHSAAVIARWAAERRAGVRFTFAVRDRDSRRLAGGCELQRVDDETANLSFWTHPHFRRRGMASEAVRRVCALAFAELGFRRIELLADPDNIASRRLAARNGFEELGVRAGRVLHVLRADAGVRPG